MKDAIQYYHLKPSMRNTMIESNYEMWLDISLVLCVRHQTHSIKYYWPGQSITNIMSQLNFRFVA